MHPLPYFFLRKIGVGPDLWDQWKIVAFDQVDRWAIYHVNPESWRRAAAGSQRQAWLDGLSQGRGNIWLRGRVDDRPDKVYVDLHPEIRFSGSTMMMASEASA
jgi:hypothetical protein